MTVFATLRLLQAAHCEHISTHFKTSLLEGSVEATVNSWSEWQLMDSAFKMLALYGDLRQAKNNIQ